MSPVERPAVAILAVGTELTSGQIINSNASWLSQQLEGLGIPTRLHLTVPDDRALIRLGLEFCQSQAQLLFVCGGLGPTSDDFTRDLIAEWAHQPLQFHQPSWDKIVERMARYNMPLLDSQKQQCFYPEQAAVVDNPDGTANAFRLNHAGVEVWVLPGPPREIADIWQHSLGPELSTRYPALQPLKPLLWECIGQGESLVADVVDKAVQGSSLQTGYRVHFPYVEVKVWCPQGEETTNQPYIAQVEQALQPWLISHGEDLAVGFLNQAGQTPLHIIDWGTRGYLSQRLAEALKTLENPPSLRIDTFWEALPGEPDEVIMNTLTAAPVSTLTFVVTGVSAAGVWALGRRQEDEIKFELFPVPMARLAVGERAQRLVGEMALHYARQF